MRLIDADELRKNVLKWMPSDPCGKEEKGFPFETDICASMVMEIDDAPTVQPDTTTHDSIPAETGKNDGDGTSGDCISRQQAIDALKEKVFHNLSDEFYGAMQVLDELPSVQPETNCSEIPNNSDTISRQAVTKFLNDWLSCLFENCHKQSASDLKMIIKDFKNLPSAQPEQHLDEWCVDCKEYDKEKRSCPRWNRVIRQTLLDAQPERKTGHWIKTARWGRVYYCNQCRNYLDFDGVNAGRGSTNFCPNCGADMRGEQNG